MKKPNILVAAMVALAATLTVSGLVGVSEVAPADAPVATHSQHSINVPSNAHSDATSVPTAGSAAADSTASSPDVSAAPSAAAVGPPSSRPAPGGSAGAPGEEVWVAPLPDVASDGARPENGKPQSLSEALAQPHGVAAAGVTPEGAGVNDGTTKQAPGLTLRPLARGEQDAGVNDAARTGGCAPGYGDGRSCLPVAPPSAAQHAGHNVEVVWTCEELLTLFPQGIPLQVRGVDPLGLDKDGNGIACA